MGRRSSKAGVGCEPDHDRGGRGSARGLRRQDRGQGLHRSGGEGREGARLVRREHRPASDPGFFLGNPLPEHARFTSRDLGSLDPVNRGALRYSRAGTLPRPKRRDTGCPRRSSYAFGERNPAIVGVRPKRDSAGPPGGPSIVRLLSRLSLFGTGTRKGIPMCSGSAVQHPSSPA